ncbi:MAG: glutamate-5-semialdehyde dehydrogenase [Oscillospiraceae bacterium]|nr:glutamate-5-semialdehyde dehydrogenase [Oscillospiraceae bacterium]
MSEVREKGAILKKAARLTALASSAEKNAALAAIADALEASCGEIIAANALDMENGRKNGISQSIADRLLLTEGRIKDVAAAVRELIDLPDPIGEVLEEWTRPNGMKISKVRVPMGVIGMIYEARPNVTVDAATIALKTGSAIMLRGSSSALNSNKALTAVMQRALAGTALPPEAVQLIEDGSRECVKEMQRLNEYLDLLIPRGGAGLIREVVDNSSVPVIETGTGNCHIYVDESADVEMAINIALNAKTQRPSVCNAAETLLVNEKWAKENLAALVSALENAGVRFHGCEKMRAIYPEMAAAGEKDWAEEYLDLEIAAKIVSGLDEAVEHIDRYGTKHTETIITENAERAALFQRAVDAAVVNHNVTGRMTDGGMFGFGAEIGISTQKLHARGPMGLREICSYKYLVSGNGQIRR